MPRARTAAVTIATAVLLAAGAAPPAQADDAAMKAGIVPALDALAPKERAALRAANKVSRISRGGTARSYRKAKRAARRALPKARRAAKATEVFGGLLLGQQPSTPRGEKAKRTLLKMLAHERKGFRMMVKSLRAYRKGLTNRANGLVAKGRVAFRKARRQANKAGRLLARL